MAKDPDNDSLVKKVGEGMIHDALKNQDEFGNPYVKGKTPINGFKEELTNNGQGADVHHHILMAAGLNLTNNFIGWGVFKATDQDQARKGRKESETEVRDDDAGYAVGSKMFRTAARGRSGDYAKLAGEIRSIICKD